MKKIISIAQTRWCWLAVAIALIVITTANVPVKSAESIDPDATQILQSMSSYMSETKAFSVDTDIDKVDYIDITHPTDDLNRVTL